MAVAFAGAVLCAGWWLLFKTYSRGGIVAAALAFAYLGWRSWKMGNKDVLAWRGTVAITLTIIVSALCISTAAAKRSAQWIEQREGSVENRLDLWKGGLRMVAQIPQGVGRGNSGETYMQWFQPIESTPRYRTLVNSYLTFLAEQGFAVFGLVIFALTALWNITNRVEGGETARVTVVGLRGSIVAFLVAGFFSTTMEDQRVWIVPGLSLAGLLAFAAVNGVAKIRLAVVGASALAVATAVCGITFLSGYVHSRQGPLEVLRRGESILISPRGQPPRRNLAVLVDRKVLGADYGKLLRRLVVGGGASVLVNGDSNSANDCELLLVTGDTVATLTPKAAGKLLLIAPAACEPALAGQLIRNSVGTTILHAFDEDGRVNFWDSQARRAEAGSKVRREVLENVGTHVEWAWDQVMACIHRSE